MLVRRPGPGTPVTIVGLARSGAAAAQWLLQLGCVVRVTESADNSTVQKAAQELTAAGALVEIGGHTRTFVEGSHLVVVSPGVPFQAPPLRWARALDIPVVSELECASWYCSGRISAITGSNGKSTVATLTGEILKAAGQDVIVCGNIGRPFSGMLDRIRPSTTVVLEVSSFQLQETLSFRPHYGCVLNVTDNHLDRHGSFANYQSAKGKMFACQSREGWALLNADDSGSSQLKKDVRAHLAFFSRSRAGIGAYIKEGWLYLELPGLSGPICRRDELASPGAHHEENALAAAALAGFLGVAPEISGKVLQTFRGLPHRQEVVATIRGVTFVNDSKSTTVASGLKAIEASPSRVVLIAGGRDKGSDFRQVKTLAKKLKAAVLIGEDGPKIAAALNGTVSLRRAADLREAVRSAFELAAKGERVILSPMCTSFDMFRDFEERGERFVEEVHELR